MFLLLMDAMTGGCSLQDGQGYVLFQSSETFCKKYAQLLGYDVIDIRRGTPVPPTEYQKVREASPPDFGPKSKEGGQVGILWDGTRMYRDGFFVHRDTDPEFAREYATMKGCDLYDIRSSTIAANAVADAKSATAPFSF